MKSIRKPHNQDAGYIAERKFCDSRIVIYHSDAQDLDVGGNRYAVVCSKHCTMAGEKSIARARTLMKNPEFCEQCIAEDLASIKNPRFREAVRISRQ